MREISCVEILVDPRSLDRFVFCSYRSSNGIAIPRSSASRVPMTNN
jgi:hypothetical protein